MSTFKAWVRAARLRTLPLSVSGIIVGSAIAAGNGYFNTTIFLLALLTTILFQVLSNFANDYGDGIKGTDNNDRVGPMRALQSGAISAKAMKRGIIITAVLSLISAIFVIIKAFNGNIFYTTIFILLGVLAIVAAIKYTVGDNAYGYVGLGDLFVFLFFGLLAVAGSYFLYTKTLHFDVFLPAITVGLLSVGVLNLNNMRDMKADKKAGKITLAVKLGENKAKMYHLLILAIAFLGSLLYLALNFSHYTNAIFCLAFVPVFIHANRIAKQKNLQEIDPELKKLAISTFIYAVLFFIGFNIFL